MNVNPSETAPVATAAAANNPMASEFHDICARLYRSDVRLTELDQFFYHRFCSLLCDNANTELTALFTDALAHNTVLEELTIDGAILFRLENAGSNLQSVKQHLIHNKNLKHLRLRWCAHEAELFDTVARCTALKSLEIHIQRPLDVYYLLSSTKSIETLSIRSAVSITGLGKGLLANSSLKYLILTGRGRDDELNDICEALQQRQHPALTTLQVRVVSTAQAASLRDLLRSPNCLLEELDLTNSNFRQVEAQVAILEGLAENKSLKRLNLSQASLGRATGLDQEAWQQAFSKNSTLETLVLASNFLKATDFDTLVEALPRCSSLKHLGLQSNFVSAAASLNVADMLQTANWTSFAIAGMDISSKAQACSLKRALNENHNLKELTLGQLCFDIEDSDEKDLAVAMIMQGLKSNTTLEKISLDCFGEKPQDVRDLLLGLMHNHNIRSLSLRESCYDPEVCDEALFKFLQTNKSVVELDLGKHSSFGESTVQALAAGLRSNTTLKVLRLYNCQAEGRDWSALFEALQTNTTLESLDMKYLAAKWDDGYQIYLQLCRYLPGMNGLKDFAFHGPGGFNLHEELVSDFLTCLEMNYCIEQVSVNVMGGDMDKVTYILNLNKLGRRFLRHANVVPAALLPHYLAKLTAPKNADAMLFNLVQTSGNWSPNKVGCVRKGSMKTTQKAKVTHDLKKVAASSLEKTSTLPSPLNYSVVKRGPMVPAIMIAKSA